MLPKIIFLTIVITVLATMACWRDRDLMDQWIGSPYEVVTFREWHRLITSGFLHADPLHLVFNMLTLYSYSSAFLFNIYDKKPFKEAFCFLLCYLGGILTANIFTTIRHRHNMNYRHLGASSGVSAIMISSCLFCPMMKLSFLYIFSMPAFLFGGLYLLGSFFFRNRGDKIGHFAHFIGGIFGFFFTIVLFPSTLWDNVELIKGAFAYVFPS
jgi:membrane associated rhomboid family serine protease